MLLGLGIEQSAARKPLFFLESDQGGASLGAGRAVDGTRRNALANERDLRF